MFDCSAIYKKESLKKHLLQGPDQLNSSIGVLTRFRKENVALTCDIEQMFQSFYINPDNRDYLRFLWFATTPGETCVSPLLQLENFGEPVRAEIHSFSDASDSGIGQISYLRMVNHRGEVRVSFLLAKSRVALLKPISIPRLELTAAVISVNVATMLKSELDNETIQCYYYTDSEVVIGYINNDA